MTTLRIPPNIPKPTLEEMRACPIIKQFDDLGIWFGINPPCIDAREMVLHISDTPQTMYHYLRRALRRLKPAWIVHTGDFVDNVKLEKRPGLIDLYRKKIKDFLRFSTKRITARSSSPEITTTSPRSFRTGTTLQYRFGPPQVPSRWENFPSARGTPMRTS